jgi:hypothetical protein
MSDSQFRTAADVHAFVENLRAACEENACNALSGELQNAMQLGSSGLEILGALKGVLLRNRSEVERLLGTNGRVDVAELIAFVDRAFGR